MRRETATLLVLLLCAPAAARPEWSADASREAGNRPPASSAETFAASFREQVRQLKRDAESLAGSAAPSGLQRVRGILQRADELDEEASRVAALDRAGLRRAKRSLRRELKRLRRELERTPRQ